MKKIAILSLILGSFMTACKDESPKPEKTKKDLIVGKWQAEFYAEDFNKNEIIDESEKYEEIVLSATFNADGTGTTVLTEEAGSIQTINFTYTISSDEQYVTLYSSTLPGDGNMKQKIVTLDASKLLLSIDDAESGIGYTQWNSYKKIN